ncbi:RHS repeat-associated core domain-containing protein [Desertivirga xinjiangensis]|uniref:RHS repeat-associated core domain-containing protein n=1 Tax=Desertivirga xinjiangensis TaxID=539206 RepID=UPI0021093D11|nr:RHS repeat-associated core domain-containing protein [Pedobacter xinjiangensis]
MASRINLVHSENNLTDIQYNILNLPRSLKAGGTTLNYIYDATGTKLRKVAGSVTTDYVRGIQYTGNTLDFIQTEVGRAVPNATGYKYEYNLTDHLGNVRFSFDIYDGSVRKLQEDDYYPFGLQVARHLGTTPNKYLYNGKEIQKNELRQYDYGARFYDPVIGRWSVIDPMAEKYLEFSPYNYALNDPVNKLDPNGMYVQSSLDRKITDRDEIARFVEEAKRAKEKEQEKNKENKKNDTDKKSTGGQIVDGSFLD